MTDLTLDRDKLLPASFQSDLYELRQLDLRIEGALKKISKGGSHRGAAKETLIALADRKIQLSRKLEEAARNEIRNQNRAIKALSNSLIEAGFQKLAKTSSKGLASHRRKIAKVPLVSDEENSIYCICKKESKDDMIECDNEFCKGMWFHLKCVGLKKVPEKEWYCQDCLAASQLAIKKRTRDR